MLGARAIAGILLVAALAGGCGAPNEDRLSPYVGAWRVDPAEAERVRLANDATFRRQQDERRERAGTDPSWKGFEKVLTHVEAQLAEATRKQRIADAKRDRRDRECIVLFRDGRARMPGSPDSWQARWWFEGDSIRISGDPPLLGARFSMKEVSVFTGDMSVLLGWARTGPGGGPGMR